jgi:signal transduction histidine kinase
MSENRITSSDIEREYLRSLGDYLRSGGEGPLLQAYELGRRALARGFGVFDMIYLHHSMLISIARADFIGALPLDASAKAGQFLAESMSSFEMTHRAVSDANAALRRANQTLEEEVRRIALALHDDAGQLMVAAHIKLDEASRQLPPEHHERLAEVKTLLTKVDDRIRHLSRELRPPVLEHLGLVPALEFLASNFEGRTGLSILVESDLKDRLPPQMSIAFYRIVREALTNVHRHAKASRANIRVWQDGETVHCIVSDNGIGFDSKKALHEGQSGLGLLGIQERLNALSGLLLIRSTEGGGTEIEITAPMREVEYADTGVVGG